MCSVPDDLHHAYNQHRTAKREGNIDLTEQDFLNIPDYVDGYDDILEFRTFKNGDREVLIGKKINGYSVIVELLSNKRKSLHFKNMWGLDTKTYEKRYGKSTASHPGRSSISANDPTEVYHSAFSKDSIPQTSPGVNPGGGIATVPRNKPVMTAAEAQALYQPFIEAYAKEQEAIRFWSESQPLVERILQAREDAMVEQLRAEYAEGFADYDSKQRQNQAIQLEGEETAEREKAKGKTSGQEDPNDGIIQSRNMAMGFRRPASHVLTEEEIASVKADAEALGIDPSVLRFNTGGRTGFSDKFGDISICGDILPDLDSKVARDRMSQRAVLAHEYYGHLMHHPSEYPIGDWRDEFRASYDAAVNAPGLSDEDRALLMIDAYDRAREAGEILNYDETARRIIYGF